MSYCSKCGNKVEENMAFCSRCGAPLKPSDVTSVPLRTQQEEKAEKQIIKYWLEWQLQEEYYKAITVERSRTYDVEDLAEDLENVLTASIIVKSRKFNDRMQKNIARKMLPAAEDDELKEIDDEIDKAEELESFPDCESI